jgi:hypothetical protein
MSSLVNGNIYRETGLLVGHWKMSNSHVEVIDYSNGKYLTSIKPDIKIQDDSSDYYLIHIDAGCSREIIYAFNKDYVSYSVPKRTIIEYSIAEKCTSGDGIFTSSLKKSFLSKTRFLPAPPGEINPIRYLNLG